MLESFVFIASGWLMTAAATTARNEQIAADETVLKNAAVAFDNASLLNFFKTRTLLDGDRETVHKLIRQLGADSYRLREHAMAELIGRGPVVLEMLREAAKDDDLEIVRRAEKCLARIEEKDVSDDVAPAAAACSRPVNLPVPWKPCLRT